MDVGGEEGGGGRGDNRAKKSSGDGRIAAYVVPKTIHVRGFPTGRKGGNENDSIPTGVETLYRLGIERGRRFAHRNRFDMCVCFILLFCCATHTRATSHHTSTTQ